MSSHTKTTKKDTTEVVPSHKEIVPIENSNVNFNAETLIAQAINQKVPVETMERLLAMAEKMQAIKAKQEFDRAMAKFQSECPTIVKTKEVKTKSGQVAYRYAPLESIVEQVKKPLQENGFSYSTNMEVLPAGVKVKVKVTHIIGHSETTEMEVPLGERTQIMSASQVTAAASTFAKRYAFCNAFGILTGDEDTDARPQDSDDTQTEQPQRAYSPKKASDKQVELIRNMIGQKRLTDVVLAQKLPFYKTAEELNIAEASETITFLKTFIPETSVTVTPNGLTADANKVLTKLSQAKDPAEIMEIKGQLEFEKDMGIYTDEDKKAIHDAYVKAYKEIMPRE